MMITHNTDTHSAYMDHLGLNHNPFPVAPDDANFYLSDTIEEIIAEIVHGVCARKGFIMLTGGVGLGKTTITRHILQILSSKEICTSLVFHTSLKDVALLREINRDFGLRVGDTHHDGDQLGDQLQRLNEFLVEKYSQGHNCAIVIDDAQNLDHDSLELLRMISNLEVDQQKIVQILLVGQTELITTLNSRAMRQLYSRIVIRKVVRSLSHDELRSYILFKLNTAGNQGRITFTHAAYGRIFRLTKGNFRKVNLLMDRCLYAICHRGSHTISPGVVRAAAADLYPERTNTGKHTWAVAASILLPLILAASSWSLHLYTSRDSMAAGQTQVSTHYPVPAQAVQVVPGDLTTVGEDAEALRGDSGTIPVDPAIATFLNIYQLDPYADEFQQALRSGKLATLAGRIFGETGYQLVELRSVPEAIRQRYGALAFSIGQNQPPTWLLFWQPKLELRRFYYAYRGKEIYQLQKLLAGLNLYRYKLDGIVGSRLMDAVIRFQKQTGLPVTGFPDPVTIFWVYHQNEKVTHG